MGYFAYVNEGDCGEPWKRWNDVYHGRSVRVGFPLRTNLRQSQLWFEQCTVWVHSWRWKRASNISQTECLSQYTLFGDRIDPWSAQPSSPRRAGIMPLSLLQGNLKNVRRCTQTTSRRPTYRSTRPFLWLFQWNWSAQPVEVVILPNTTCWFRTESQSSMKYKLQRPGNRIDFSQTIFGEVSQRSTHITSAPMEIEWKFEINLNFHDFVNDKNLEKILNCVFARLKSSNGMSHSQSRSFQWTWKTD